MTRGKYPLCLMCGLLLCFMCPQVPVPNLSASVHEAGKSVEKADAIFSQERDPRFAEMFAGISACKWQAMLCCEAAGLRLHSDHLEIATLVLRHEAAGL